MYIGSILIFPWETSYFCSYNETFNLFIGKLMQSFKKKQTIR